MSASAGDRIGLLPAHRMKLSYILYCAALGLSKEDVEFVRGLSVRNSLSAEEAKRVDEIYESLRKVEEPTWVSQ